MNIQDKFLDNLIKYLMKLYSRKHRDEAVHGIMMNTSDAMVHRFATKGFDVIGVNRYDAEFRRASGELFAYDSIFNLVTNVGLDESLDKFFKGSSYTAAFYSGLINEVATSTITGITQANPGVVSTPSTTGLSNGDVVRINNVAGMTQVNGNEYTIANVVANTSFSIVDTTGFSAYTSGGNWWKDPVVAGDTMASHAGWTENTGYTEGTRPQITLGTVASQSVDNSASKAVFTANATSTITGVFVVCNHVNANVKGGTDGVLYGGGVFTGGSKAVASSDTLNVTHTFTAASA